MKIVYLDKEPAGLPACVATIGFFDGVHEGHRVVIRHLTDLAKGSNLASTIVTFNRHPRQVVHSDYVPQLLTTLEEKVSLLSSTSADQCVVLPFDHEMAALSAQQFMEKVLFRQLNVRKLLIGYDNRFGHNRSEGFNEYVSYGRDIGIEVIQSHVFTDTGVQISSSVIRRLIKEGDMYHARKYLGYPYHIAGKVIDGYKLGRKMGFPTANIDVSGIGKMIPSTGAYAVSARIEGHTGSYPAMMNIGVRPTFGGEGLSLEVHLIGFHGDLYGKRLNISFLSKLRDERHFDDIHALRDQLKRDAAQSELIFKKEK